MFRRSGQCFQAVRLRPAVLSAHRKGPSVILTSFAVASVARSTHIAVRVALFLVIISGCSRSGGTPQLPEPEGPIAARTFPEASTVHHPSSRYDVLFNFGSNAHGYDGADPLAGLIDVSGTLYGTTAFGGPINQGGYGTVFSITTAGKETVLYTFNGDDAAFPAAAVVYINGTLYGTTAGDGVYGPGYGDGTVYAMHIDGTNFRVLHKFTGGADGMYPMAALIAVKGRLYGTTYQGGAYNEGTVFSVRMTDGEERVLHSFSGGSDGAYPLAGLTDAKGSLYGTTQQGGEGRSAGDSGTVFRVSENGTETVLYSFSGPDGAFPRAGLIVDRDTLFGTTGGGGAASLGTVFSISTAGKNERVLYSFGSDSSDDGTAPVAGLTAVKMLFYGTTYSGGAAGYGTIFSVSKGGREHVLHSFGADYTNDGIYPEAGLINVQQTLYGTTYEGGISEPSCPRSGDVCDYGTVFALEL